MTRAILSPDSILVATALAVSLAGCVSNDGEAGGGGAGASSAVAGAPAGVGAPPGAGAFVAGGVGGAPVAGSSGVAGVIPPGAGAPASAGAGGAASSGGAPASGGAPPAGGTPASGSGGGGGASAMAGAPGPSFLPDAGDGWLSLLEASWSIPPDTETYVCARFTVPERIYVGAMKPLSPVGTHHTVLSVSDVPGAPDGVTDCTAFDNGDRILFGSGVGTNDLTLPDGLAIPIEAGQQLTLNLHLFNFANTPLEGTSGSLVRALADDEVTDRLDGVLVGPLDLQIPPGRVTEIGHCTFSTAATVVALMPHMHQMGVHMKVVAERAAGELTLHDGPYDFDSQENLLIEPVTLQPGERLRVECTYENTTSNVVRWGDSSLSEMCFAGILRYPAGGSSSVVCSD